MKPTCGCELTAPDHPVLPIPWTAPEQYQIASDELAVEAPKPRKLIETDMKAIEKQLDAAGALYTPGRLPDWKPGKQRCPLAALGCDPTWDLRQLY